MTTARIVYLHVRQTGLFRAERRDIDVAAQR
jgi:hypothetical protein